MKNKKMFFTISSLIPSITIAQSISETAVKGAISGFAIVAFIFIIKLIYVFAKKGAIAAKEMTKSKERKLLEIDNVYYEKASNEIENNNQDTGLWLKSMSISDGDINKQKAVYIRLRAKQLNEKSIPGSDQ